jgi:GAF domain-containing protein
MAEELKISVEFTKSEKYEELLPQLRALISEEDDLIANLSNVAAGLKQVFDFFWVGFYLVKGDELILGPFQGPVACTRIQLGKGVCGTAWKQKETLLVPDVEKFPGHISCNSASRSEIVVPVLRKGEVAAVLDVDSDRINEFDETDKSWLEQLTRDLSDKF